MDHPIPSGYSQNCIADVVFIRRIPIAIGCLSKGVDGILTPLKPGFENYKRP
jgi:hypothetical protein